jgi:peptidoglycan/xylan/chitin deacetylase (PgdA/CDA1 family)
MYLTRSPRWLKWMYPNLVWDVPVEKDEKFLYLTFDDGPHPIATPFVLDQLKLYNAKATFFCVGRNVADHNDIYKDIIEQGHKVGNHTYDHLNGWKVKDQEYIDDIAKAAELIDSKLFRPPYGRITKFQSSVLTGKISDDQSQTSNPKFQIIMWSVLAGDWDKNITAEKCYENVVMNAKPGSIIVFHDSAKALERLQYALPKALAYFAQQGYQFKALPF